MEAVAPARDAEARASVAEIAGVLSLATDVALGCSYEHGLRRAVLAVGLAEAVGADERHRCRGRR